MFEGSLVGIFAFHTKDTDPLATLSAFDLPTAQEFLGLEGKFSSISVKVEDRPGVLAAITKTLADLNADIRNAEARTFDNQTAAIELTLRVQDLRHLEKAVKSVRGVSGVLDVERQAVAR